MNRELGAAADLALDLEQAVMAVDHMLDDPDMADERALSAR
jgi:Fe-S-cluster formation regulator IscX/YfhJ